MQATHLMQISLRHISSVLILPVVLCSAAAAQKNVSIEKLGISLHVPAHFNYELQEDRFHTYSGPEGTIKIYLSYQCCKSPLDAAQAAIARARSGRHPRSYIYMHHEPVITAGGLSGIRGTFGVKAGGELRPFVEKHFLPLPGGGVCCVSVVSRVESRRAALSQMVLASYKMR